MAALQISVHLDRTRADTLTTQIVDQIREAIRCSRLLPGLRLPSSRQLSEQLAISRNTVVRAYDLLVMEGLLESRPASGIYVAEQASGAAPVPPRRDEAPPSCMPLPLRHRRPRPPETPGRERLLFDFRPGRPDPDQFPMKTWRRLLQANLTHGGAAGLTGAGETAGLPALRTAIANHLAASRGIVADPGRILIISGLREALTIAARLFLARGTLALIEDPGYQPAAAAFEAAGAELASVAVDSEGVVVDDLPKRAASLLYTTPAHQYPTGAVLSAARRRDLIAWARSTGCYLIEDDYDGDIRTHGTHLPPLAALAPDCTIHVGSFSASLGAGLRLGYAVMPAQIAEAAVCEKALLNSGNPWLEQATLADFMQSGSYAAHLLRVRAHYKDKRDALVEALQRNFGEVRIDGQIGGLHLVWHLPPGIPDASSVEALARRARIGIAALRSAQVRFDRPNPLASRAVMLGFAPLSRKQIEKGIARLSDAIDDAIDDPATDMAAFFSDQFAPPPGPQLASRDRQRPALRLSPPRRATSPANVARQGHPSMPVLKSIYRYPIKGLSAQPLGRVDVTPKQPLPHDRVFALVRPGAPYDLSRPAWGKKGLFVMLMLEEALARVRTVLDVETGKLTISQDNQTLLVADLSDDVERAKVEDLFWQLVPSFRSPPTLVRSAGGHFMDKPDNVMSLINLATLRSLEQQWGVNIDPLRFRANFYIDDAPPWEEFDWVGSDIRIGEVTFRVDRRNGRCGATNVNPQTGRRDLDLPGSLRAAFGHKELGVYLVARDCGRVAAGDAVATPQPAGVRIAASALLGAAVNKPGPQRFICGGCYFIYEPSAGLPEQGLAPGTPFADIDVSWRCPDCGTEKTTFRPYVEPPLRNSARRDAG
ncbi:aminotransferase class I/II-fold pyridoxal phosphate-dependent enzyme [Rhodopseudomonas sp. B29]|uniref:MocR-like pyridoxine biosynthesis transcription factor PdxR n=1 Tax=Rhodopseudomonas sp. B29 TaxID=95607 RepID=UPI000349B53D|nr:aminotransferase class I/II-fold pyridoxal phosphate-dependent enzyme [Rhodopseudomonas sp. B29]